MHDKSFTSDGQTACECENINIHCMQYKIQDDLNMIVLLINTCLD